MSHIPAAAMPHAQTHHAEPDPAPTAAPAAPALEHERDAPETPWVAMAIGGAVALGGALTAAWLLRRDGKGAHRGGKRKPRGKKAAGKRRASRAAPPVDA